MRGLINGQFIVRDDGVYLLEVNPRASRTVPFLSKVTGVPMVELATRVALGERLADLGWQSGLLPPRDLVAVKAPVFSTTKLRGVDPMLGPAMQSTGEVIGIHADPRVAMAKALVAASLRPPVPAATARAAVALLSIADRDKEHLGELARELVSGRLYGSARRPARLARCARSVTTSRRSTGWVRRRRRAIGARRDRLRRRAARRQHALARVASGPDAGAIRLAATAEGILCLTSIDTALAAAARARCRPCRRTSMTCVRSTNGSAAISPRPPST